MFGKHMIDKVLITLDVDSKTALFILLSKDGTVHRKGNGNPYADLPAGAGRSHDGHFEALMMTVNEGVFNHTGVIKMPDRKGTENQLTIIFQGPNDLDYSFRVVYGSESEGPPSELAQILINAVKITENWYSLQLAELKGNNSPWWQFWK